MNQEILTIFQEIYNKQDILGTNHNLDIFQELDISEVHTIDVIGRVSQVNGSDIAEILGFTRGGVSKILKKLVSKGYIVTYQLPQNRKSVYYQLTPLGKNLFNKHQKAHLAWQKRDLHFLETIDPDEKKVVLDFLQQFSSYLTEKIKELE